MRRCSKCGAELRENAKFCPKCGNVVERKTEVKDFATDNGSDTKYCKKCGAVLKDNVNFCQNCGEKVEDAAESKKFCKNCGAEIKAGTVFCSKCGSKVIDNPVSMSKPKPASKRTVSDPASEKNIGMFIMMLICAYFIIKQIVNLIIGFSVIGIFQLIIMLILAIMLLIPSDTIPQISLAIKYSNFILAIIMLVNIITFIPGIFSGMSHMVLYLIECILDIISIVIIFAVAPVRNYFKEK